VLATWQELRGFCTRLQFEIKVMVQQDNKVRAIKTVSGPPGGVVKDSVDMRR
jgi:hypothetical protein